MSIIRHEGLNVTVNTIADRNNILKKPDNLTVTVIDAIGDVNAGSNTAVYRWSNNDGGKWILLSVGAEKSLTFATEELRIYNGSVISPNVPSNGHIWDIQIINDNRVMAYPRCEDLNISGNEINGLDSWNGLKIRYTYAYGTMSAQMEAILDAKVTFYETDIDPLSVVNNKVKAGNMWHDTSDEGRVAVCITVDNNLIWLEV